MQSETPDINLSMPDISLHLPETIELNPEFTKACAALSEAVRLAYVASVYVLAEEIQRMLRQATPNPLDNKTTDDAS